MRLFGSLVGERTETLPSVFGALSGKWHLVGEKGTFDVTFSKNTFTAKALNHDNTTDSVTFSVCDGTASGSTSTGHEFAASRE